MIVETIKPETSVYLKTIKDLADKYTALYNAAAEAIIVEKFGRRIPLDRLQIDWESGEISYEEWRIND